MTENICKMEERISRKYAAIALIFCALAFMSGLIIGDMTSPQTRAEYENYIRGYCKQLPIDNPGTYCVIVDGNYITPEGDTIRVKA